MKEWTQSQYNLLKDFIEPVDKQKRVEAFLVSQQHDLALFTSRDSVKDSSMNGSVPLPQSLPVNTACAQQNIEAPAMNRDAKRLDEDILEPYYHKGKILLQETRLANAENLLDKSAQNRKLIDPFARRPRCPKRPRDPIGNVIGNDRGARIAKINQKSRSVRRDSIAKHAQAAPSRFLVKDTRVSLSKHLSGLARKSRVSSGICNAKPNFQKSQAIAQDETSKIETRATSAKKPSSACVVQDDTTKTSSEHAMVSQPTQLASYASSAVSWDETIFSSVQKPQREPELLRETQIAGPLDSSHDTGPQNDDMPAGISVSEAKANGPHTQWSDEQFAKYKQDLVQLQTPDSTVLSIDEDASDTQSHCTESPMFISDLSRFAPPALLNRLLSASSELSTQEWPRREQDCDHLHAKDHLAKFCPDYRAASTDCDAEFEHALVKDDIRCSRFAMQSSGAVDLAIEDSMMYADDRYQHDQDDRYPSDLPFDFWRPFRRN